MLRSTNSIYTEDGSTDNKHTPTLTPMNLFSSQLTFALKELNLSPIAFKEHKEKVVKGMLSTINTSEIVLQSLEQKVAEEAKQCRELDQLIKKDIYSRQILVKIEASISEIKTSLQRHRLKRMSPSQLEKIIDSQLIQDAKEHSREQHELKSVKYRLIYSLQFAAIKSYYALLNQSDVVENDDLSLDCAPLGNSFEAGYSKIKTAIDVMTSVISPIPSKAHTAFNHVFAPIAELDDDDSLHCLSYDTKTDMKSILVLATEIRDKAKQYNRRIHFSTYYPQFYDSLNEVKASSIFCISETQEATTTTICNKLKENYKKIGLNEIANEEKSLTSLSKTIHNKITEIQSLFKSLHDYRLQRATVRKMLRVLTDLWKKRQCKTTTPEDLSSLPDRKSLLLMMGTLLEHYDKHTPAIGLEKVTAFAQQHPKKYFRL